MLLPCHCSPRRVRVAAGRVEPFDPARDCRGCWLFSTNTAVNRTWGGDGAVLPADPEPPPAPARPLPVLPPCVHEGDVLEACQTCGPQGGRHVRECDLHGRCTREPVGPTVRACRACPDYRPDPTLLPAPPAPTAVARPSRPAAGDPAAGVVFGCYLWPELIALQCRLLRQTCGDVPVLVSWDHDPAHPDRTAAARRTAAEEGADFLTDATRRGHTAGDAAAFWRGVEWASGRGLAALAKVSQRHVLLAPRWVQAAAADLALSGLPLLARGSDQWPVRTEAVVLDVPRWHQPDVLAELRAVRFRRGSAGGESMERQFHRLLVGRLGGVYLPWGLLPADRTTPKADAVSPDAYGRAAYDEIAARVGVVLPEDFRTGGWTWQLRNGGYDHG